MSDPNSQTPEQATALDRHELDSTVIMDAAMTALGKLIGGNLAKRREKFALRHTLSQIAEPDNTAITSDQKEAVAQLVAA